MHIRTRGWITVAVIAGMVAFAQPARASGPLVTDPSGDATALGLVECVVVACPAPVSQPQLDIVSGDIALVGTDLVFDIGILDLDRVGTTPLDPRADDWAAYYTVFQVGPDANSQYHWVHVSTARKANGTVYPARVAVLTWGGNVPRTVNATYDDTGNVVTVTVPLADLNDALDEACGCLTVGSGTVLTSVWMETVSEVTMDDGTPWFVYRDSGFAPSHTV
jgi:hypothetical protein